MAVAKDGSLFVSDDHAGAQPPHHLRSAVMWSQAAWLVAGACLATAATAGDAAAGLHEAAACAVCHGPLGLSKLPEAPHLAGQSAIYTAARLKVYRGGKRQHEVMTLMAKPPSDVDIDIDNLAAWFTSIRI